MPHTLFISDLHLCETRPRVNELFFAFMEKLAPQAKALYILGDLFEYWIGDDDASEGLNARIKAALATTVTGGTAVSFMHGNRDFLVGERFVRETGLALLPDPTEIDLHGRRALLMHGDTLCTDDVDYQRFREMVRSPRWQRDFLARPLEERRREVEELRRRSEEAKRGKTLGIMDVAPAAVAAALGAHDVSLLIHGHTHRPAHHVHSVQETARDRWVLPDWHEKGGFLRVDSAGIVAHEFP